MLKLTINLPDSLAAILKAEARAMYGSEDVSKRAHYILLEALLSNPDVQTDPLGLLASMLSTGEDSKDKEAEKPAYSVPTKPRKVMVTVQKERPPLAMPTKQLSKTDKGKQPKKVESKSTLMPPTPEFQGKPNTQYLVWSWMIRQVFDVHFKWYNVGVPELGGALQVNPHTLMSALESLTHRGWIEVTNPDAYPRTALIYTFTREARLWFLDRKNQTGMIERGIIVEASHAPVDIFDTYLDVSNKETVNVDSDPTDKPF